MNTNYRYMIPIMSSAMLLYVPTQEIFAIILYFSSSS